MTTRPAYPKITMPVIRILERVRSDGTPFKNLPYSKGAPRKDALVDKVTKRGLIEHIEGIRYKLTDKGLAELKALDHCEMCRTRLSMTYMPASEDVPLDMCMRCGGRVRGLIMRAVERAKAK